MKILLACGAGLSTSVLMKKMQKWCAERGEELVINAVSTHDAVENWKGEYDCILVGPQVSYRLAEMRKELPDVPIEGIPSFDYAVGNAENIMKLAHRITGK